MVVTHAQTGKPFATKYALTVFGRDRNTVENAYPGDIVGLVNANALAPGHTLFSEKKVEFPPIPSFAPEHFSVLRAESASKYKQFRRAVDQLESEGVVQILRNDIRGDASPVMAAVGPMQFEVVAARMKAEFNVEARMEPLGYALAGAPTPSPPSNSAVSAASRCSPATTGCCWLCSATSGGCSTSRRRCRS